MLASLRHLAAEYDVDGFCFLNAETLTLGAHFDDLGLSPDLACWTRCDDVAQDWTGLYSKSGT